MAEFLLYERLTEVTICALPPDDDEHRHFAVRVVNAGGDLWSVMHYDRDRLNATTGRFDYGPCPDDADREQWMADHYFSYDRAVELARQVAPTMTCNGYTVEDVRAWRRKEQGHG